MEIKQQLSHVYLSNYNSNLMHSHYSNSEWGHEEIVKHKQVVASILNKYNVMKSHVKYYLYIIDFF